MAEEAKRSTMRRSDAIDATAALQQEVLVFLRLREPAGELVLLSPARAQRRAACMAGVAGDDNVETER